jgi:hypothetical protein
MGICFYGVVEAESPLDFEDVGIAGGRIYAIQYRDIEAVVNPVPDDHTVALEDASTYERILRRVMEIGAVIPMSFGTVAKDPDEIEKILKRGYMTFKHTMDKIRGKIQVNVAASWREKAVLERVLSEDRKSRALRRRMVRSPADQTLRIELGRRVKGRLNEKREEIVPVITTALQGVSDDFEENRLKDKNMIVNASFLIEKTREPAFYTKAETLEKRYLKLIKLVIVGPLPPYNFTRIEIKTADFKAVQEAQKMLELGEASSISEIHQAFNKLAQSYHPDRHPNDPKAAEKFGRIRKAYDVLTEYCEHRLFSVHKSDVEATIIIRERPN